MEQNEKTCTFAGLEISPGILTIKDGKPTFLESFKENSYGKAFGINEGSTFFSLENIENLSDSIPDGWRLPTAKEWKRILTRKGDVRPGSMVNGYPFSHYAFMSVKFANTGKTVNALMIFPDGETIKGRYLYKTDAGHQTPGLTEKDVNEYISQGAAVIYGLGHYDMLNGMWTENGLSGFYWSSGRLDEDDATGAYFDENYLYGEDTNDAAKSFHPVILVR